MKPLSYFLLVLLSLFQPANTFASPKTNAPAVNTPTPSLAAVNISELVSGDPILATREIDIQVRPQGVVEIVGEVANLYEAERARKLVKSMKGVTALVDRLTIIEQPDDVPPAAQMKRIKEILAAIPHAPVAELNKRVVTLSGGVPNRGVAELTRLKLLRIPGLLDVKDNTTVVPTMQIGDQAIRKNLQLLISKHVLAAGADVDVKVDGGTVEITGTARSLGQREILSTFAWRCGATAVVASEVRVENDDSAPFRLLAHKRYDHNDSEIAETLRVALATDPRIMSLAINVSVSNRVAVLNGTVRRYEQSVAAEETAADVIGVTQVNNQIQLAPLIRFGDEDLAQAVRRHIKDSAPFGRVDIEVLADQGTVWLDGAVDYQWERLELLSLVSEIPGVVGIEPKIRVLKRMGDLDDEAIKKQVKLRLAASPMLFAEDIHVEVVDERVILTGTVNSLIDKVWASRIAENVLFALVENRLRLAASKPASENPASKNSAPATAP